MCNPNMEAKVHELMELKRMKEELEAEIAAAEDAPQKTQVCIFQSFAHFFDSILIKSSIISRI